MLSGDALKLGNTSHSPGKSYLFFLTSPLALEWDYPEIVRASRQSSLPFELSGALWMVLENPGDYLHRSCSCTHNRIRSPR